jgi:hypothetical protein
MTTSNTPKLTKFQKFEMLKDIAEVQSNEVLREFVEHEMELLSNRKSAPKKQTAIQKENATILEAILAGMKQGRPYTITEIIKEIPACAELTNQRVTAIMRPAIEDNRIIRIEDKRKVYFSLA